MSPSSNHVHKMDAQEDDWDSWSWRRTTSERHAMRFGKILERNQDLHLNSHRRSAKAQTPGTDRHYAIRDDLTLKEPSAKLKDMFDL